MGQMRTLTINGEKYDIVPVVPASSVTLLASAWVADGDKYSQVVEVSGVTAHTKVDLQPTAEQLEEFHYKVLAFVTENDGGKVTVYSIGDKPENDHTIQITKTEVEGVGKIRGNTVGTTMPKPDWNQTDPKQADYIHNKPALLGKITEAGGEIFNYYTEKVYTGDNPPKEYPGNTAVKGAHAQNFGTHADGEYSSARGWCSTASGGIADASGKETEASGYCSSTSGFKTVANKKYSSARGNNSKATGESADASGELTEASGYCATSQGFKTKASGTCSSTQGRETEAKQYASSAQGRGTIAACRNQSARGAWNVEDVPDANGDGKYAEIVGGGKNKDDRRNIYTLDWDGNAHFAGKVYANGVDLTAINSTETLSGYNDANSITENGHYRCRINAPINDLGTVTHVSYSQVAGHAHQRFVTVSGLYTAERRQFEKVWDEWEWVNPPMELGVEYRTTERYNGKPVYKKRVELALADGWGEEAPDSTLTMLLDVENLADVVSCSAFINNKPLPQIYTDKFCNIESIDYSYIRINRNNYPIYDGEKLRAIVAYTKE